MALYLGSSGKRKVMLNGVAYCINSLSMMPIVNGVRLLSIDNYILTDSNGVYLIPSDYIEPIISNILLSSDNYILTDLNKLYLTFKESE